MAVFLYRCPRTGLKVQGWYPEELSAKESHTYETLECTACSGIHLVDPLSGKVLGDDEE
jgi:hypothetical protein